MPGGQAPRRRISQIALLVRAATPEQQRAVGNQTGRRVFLDLYGNKWDLIGPAESA